MNWHDHFLPHPHPDIPGHHRRAKFLHPPALASYVLFLTALLFSGSLIREHLPGVLGFATNINFNDLVTDTNNERVANNLRPLTVNTLLNNAAQAKAAYMFKYDFWAHVAPDGTTPWYFISQAGYDYRYAGENLARDFGDSAGVVQAWMNSPSHRENMLNPNYTDIGFAVVNGTLEGYETTLVVQMFGKPLSSTALVDIPAQAAVTEAPKAPAVTKVPAVPNLIVPSSPSNPASVPVPVASESPKLSVTPISKPESPGTLPPSGSILPAVDVASASKGITLALGLFLTSLFTVDGYFMWRRHLLRISGSTAAHLALLILALIGIWYTNVGVIV